MSSRPSVLVTRRIPSSVLARLEAVADVDLHRNGDLPHDELISGRYPLERINDALDSARSGAALRNVVTC